MRTRLQYDTRPAAQTRADAIHQWMIANNSAYASSVQAGHTLRWAIPYQDIDENGNVIEAKWSVNVKDRCMLALNTSERQRARAP